MILSPAEAHALLRARGAGEARATVSLDLGRTRCELQLEGEGVRLPNEARLAWARVEQVAASDPACFAIRAGAVEKVQLFSAAFNCFYSLLPTAGAPTMLLSGIPMHRIKGIDPHDDTLRKIRTLAPVGGRVLDTTTGLGYTAIEAARTAEEVVTVEIDPTVLELARLNPWSQPLFTQPNIRQVIGDAAEQIEQFGDERFTCIFHDPPTFRLAGNLYSGAFYRQLYRVLARRGRLFHYIGDLESPSGRIVARGAVRRLQEAGFTRVTRRPEAFGLVAVR